MSSSSIGKPKYKYQDKVSFKINDKTVEGSIYIIDAYGTFENPNEVSYDILSESENTLYKHIPESEIL
jgi:hypothetical protein